MIRRNVKKGGFCVWLTAMLLALLPVVGTEASSVKQLDIHALLHKDGSASIEERWLINLNDQDAKSEWYVAHQLRNGMSIDDLSVEGYVPGEEGLVRFETLGKWDVDASRKAKTGKCGLNNHGQEICWGFGDYGEHEYVVSYVIRHLVQRYDSCDGFNHCFVDMNCRVEDVVVSIEAEEPIRLSEENTRRWAFGCQGTIEFKENVIVMTPSETLSRGKRVIVMLEMDKGMFSPDREADEPWADRKQRALAGNDFQDESADDEWSVLEIIGAVLLIIVALVVKFFTGYAVILFFSLIWLILCGVWWVVSLAPLRTWLRRKRLGIERGRYCRDVSKDWSLVKNKMLVDSLAYISGMSNERIIGAVLLKLMARGDLTIVREVYKKKECDMLKIVNPVREVDKEAKGDEQLCNHALKLLTLASGDDLILQPNEFKKWCNVKKNHPDIKAFLKLMEPKYDRKYIKRHAADVFGLKAFLKDFSLLNERSVMEVSLWDDYMVYAEFFGVADKVRAEMAKTCPEYLKMSKLGQSLDVAQETNIIYSFSDTINTSATHAIERAAERSTSSSGFSSGYSSYSSSGGGGGYSGGGGGGGR